MDKVFHALVGVDDAVLRIEALSAPPPALSPAKGLRWLPIEDDAPTPAAGEVLDGPVVTVGTDKVRRVWTPRPKTVAERLTEVQAARRAAYPATGDQLDALFKARAGDAAELAVIDAAIKAVKTAYPQPVA